MKMSEGEKAWIRSEYNVCPLFKAIERFAKDVSAIEGMPAEHPSLLFYLTVNAVDDIKCTGNKDHRLKRCMDLKNDILHYLKLKLYDDCNKRAAEVICCVRYSLTALSLMEYMKEICIMSEHINSLITDTEQKERIEGTARKCFSVEDLSEWLDGYFEGRDFISETITSSVGDMRKANPIKEEVVKKGGKGNRKRELFSDMKLKERMKKEILKRLDEKNLSITNISLNRNYELLACLVDFYKYMKTNSIIQDFNNYWGYLRFLKESGFTFDTNDDNVVKKLRKVL